MQLTRVPDGAAQVRESVSVLQEVGMVQLSRGREQLGHVDHGVRSEDDARGIDDIDLAVRE